MEHLTSQVKDLTFANFINHCHDKLWVKAEQKGVAVTELSLPTAEQHKEKKDKKRVFKGLINDRPHVTIFLGRKGSGKTSLLLKLLLTEGGLCKVYKKIIIISATFLQQWDKTWSKLHKNGLVVYTSLSDALLDKIYHDCDSEKQQTLVISDDMDEQFRKGVESSRVNRLISNSRHLPCSFIFLSQSIVQLPTIVRRNADCFCLFGACSYCEVELIWKEVSLVSRKHFWKMFTKATCKPYGFLVCSIEKGKLAFYDSFDHLLICEQEPTKNKSSAF